ncbi:MAG: transposase [Solirubrobacteraceae bacterium]
MVNARHVKQVPGRKTDCSDAAWICQLMEAGLLKPSFVPPKPVRELRELTRRRKTLVRDRQRESSRLHKILEDTGIKLGCVTTDILGKSGRDMLDALVAGTTDPIVLADLARGKLRTKIPALREALEGQFDTDRARADRLPDPRAPGLPRRRHRAPPAEIEEVIAPFARFPGETPACHSSGRYSTCSSATPATARPSPTSTANTSTESSTSKPTQTPSTRRSPPPRLTPHGNLNRERIYSGKGTRPCGAHR